MASRQELFGSNPRSADGFHLVIFSLQGEGEDIFIFLKIIHVAKPNARNPDFFCC